MITVKKHKHTHTHIHTHIHAHIYTQSLSHSFAFSLFVFIPLSLSLCVSLSLLRYSFFISLFLCLCFPHWSFCHFLSIPVSFHTFSFSTVLPVLLSLFLVLYPFATPYLSTSIISIVYKCVWFSLFLSRKVAHTNYVLFILAN